LLYTIPLLPRWSRHPWKCGSSPLVPNLAHFFLEEKPVCPRVAFLLYSLCFPPSKACPVHFLLLFPPETDFIRPLASIVLWFHHALSFFQIVLKGTPFFLNLHQFVGFLLSTSSVLECFDNINLLPCSLPGVFLREKHAEGFSPYSFLTFPPVSLTPPEILGALSLS